MSLRVSVIVPTYKRRALLRRCLKALANQSLVHDQYEIIVVDDEESPRTEALVRRLSSATAPALHYVAAVGTTGPAAARNWGVGRSRGQILAFTDDDCVPDPNWLEEGLKAIANVDAVGGRIVIPLPPRPTDYELSQAQLSQCEFVTANCFCRRETFWEVGGFDESFSLAWREDSDLYFKLLESHARVGSAAAALVVHPIRPAHWGVSLRQQHKIRYDALLYKKHPQLFATRIASRPPLRYYSSMTLLASAAVAAGAGLMPVATACAAAWAAITLDFACRRLARTSRDPAHVAEMLLTSAFIPPLSVFWRLYGACRFRVLFL